MDKINRNATSTKEFVMSELQKNLLNYFNQSPFKSILSIAYLIGGFFLLIYFWHIGYFPTNIKFEDLLLVSLLSSIVGILFITIIIITLIFPVVNYQSCQKLVQFEKILKYKHQTNNNNPISKIQGFVDSIVGGCINILPIEKRCNPQLSLLFLPLLTFTLLSLCIIYLEHEKIITNSIGLLIIVLLITMIVIITVFKKNLKKIFPNIGFKVMLKSKIFYTYIWNITISILSLSLSFVISYPIMSNSPELQNNGILVAIYTILFMMSFVFVNIVEQNFMKRMIINISILFIFLFTTKTIHIIPTFILKEFNLAQVNVNQLSIDEKGCKIINPDSNDTYCIEKNIRLVSNFGGMYVFDKPLDSNFTNFERYEIPQEYILSKQQILKATN